MKIKRTVAVVVLVTVSLVSLASLCPVLYTARPGEAAPVLADSAVVMDATTRRVLFERASQVPKYPASITKIVTALLVHELTRSQQVVTIGASSVGVEGSSIWLQAGEQLTTEQLLYGLLLESGNDAADALATAVAGDVDAFAELMTSRVRQLGATESTFTNPHGLPAREHATSAADMALAAAEFVEYPMLRQIVATESHKIPWMNREWERTLQNHNRFLGRSGIDGIKTGYTRSAGHTYVASATREGHQLIAVVMDTTRNGKFQEAELLLNQAFDTHTWVHPTTTLMTVPVRNGQTEAVGISVELAPVPVLADGSEKLLARWVVADRVEAPVYEGQPLGEVIVSVNGQVTYRAPALADQTVLRRSSWFDRLKDGLRSYLRLE